MSASLPTGIVTFYFSDLEGSTRLVQTLDDEAWSSVIDRHFAITEGFLAGTSGTKIRTVGDEFFLVFPDELEAATLAAAVQRAHAEEEWPEGVDLRARIGLHTGFAALGGDDYVGFDVHLAARISSAAHGGQTVVSAETAKRIRDHLPEGVMLDDLGTHRLKDIEEPQRLFQMTVRDLQSRFPALRTEGRGELRFTPDDTAFVGREKEIGEVASLIRAHRLVTLTGPGGSGKTRLSKRVAEDIVDDFHDGIYFIDLSALEDHKRVMSTVLTELGVHQTQGVEPLELVTRALARSEACLILDNLEQVIAARDDIRALIDGTGRLAVLATSRSPLRIRGEQEYPVPPLPVPSDGASASLAKSEAVQLFVSRARDIDPGFDLERDPGTAAAVARIVTGLDGLPLAIELAAARTRLLPPADLANRLDSSLDLLRSRRADLPPRQRTLRGAIQWSYDLLDGESKHLLGDLSVFAGGCRLAELVTVCSPSYPGILEDSLENLLEQSLVRRDGERYRMLVTIREFALERLNDRGDEASIRDRHAIAYRTLAETAAPRLVTVDRSATLDLLAADHDNFRAALDWAIESGATDVGLALGAALWRFWQMRGHLVEARERLTALTAIEGGDAVLRAGAFEGLGGVAYWQGDFEAARQAYQSALDLVRARGSKADIARALYNLSFAHGFAGDYATGAPMLHEAEQIYEELGDDTGLGHIAWGLGNMHHLGGDLEEARDLFTESARLLHGGEDEFSYGWAVDRLGVVLSALGEIEEARERLIEALDLFTAAEDLSAMVIILNDLADNALRGGDPERALRIDGTVSALLQRTGTGLVASPVNIVEGLEDAAAHVGVERAAELRAEGEAKTVREALAYARGED